jgi:ubiquinone/menaquinone biosynthesis C-methylase UbiE
MPARTRRASGRAHYSLRSIVSDNFGRAIGVDMTEAMADRSRTCASDLGLTQVEVRLGDALNLPIDSSSVDVAISNGVLNLTPDKQQAFSEVWRVLGRVGFADVRVVERFDCFQGTTKERTDGSTAWSASTSTRER